MTPEEKKLRKPIGKERIREVVSFWVENGPDATCEAYSLKDTTMQRYLRMYKELFGEAALKESKLLRELKTNFTPAELRSMASGGKREYDHTVHDVQIGGSGKYRVAILTDLHLGSKFTSEPFVLKIIDIINNMDLDAVLMPGDITEGMSGREGHIYELTHFGFSSQLAYAVDILSLIKHPIFMIDGNHDRWFLKKNGAKIVQHICEKIDSATFLGHDYAVLRLADGLEVGLWHGEDGSSYAYSYRPQKIVESIDPEKRPQVLFCGHDHKYVSVLPQGILTVGCGALQSQSNWMRAKRREAQVGFITGTLEFDGPKLLGWEHKFFIPKFLGLNA